MGKYILEIGSKDERYLCDGPDGWAFCDRSEAKEFDSREAAAEYAAKYVPREIYVVVRVK